MVEKGVMTKFGAVEHWAKIEVTSRGPGFRAHPCA